MVFDAIADAEMLDVVDRLTSARQIELLAALATMQEIGRTPLRDRRRRLQRVRVLVVPPPDEAAPTVRALASRVRTSPGISDEDAGIALTADLHGAPLVTEDRALREAAGVHLPELELWRWATDLEPRLRALAPDEFGARSGSCRP
jgi:predicted nucleic acid-binding protein